MNKNNIIYASGFIDGEGCITTAGYSFRLTISSTDKGILLWFQQTFGGCFNNQYLPANPNHNMAWKWILSKKKELNSFLKEIYPHLKLKKAQAKAVIDYLDKYPSQRTGGKTTQLQREEFLTVKKLVRSLKTDKHLF